MSTNHIIIIPIKQAWHNSADYIKQTYLHLIKIKKFHQVIIYAPAETKFFLIKNKKLDLKNVNLYQPINLLPFNRLTLISQLNQLINLLIIKLKFFKKKIVIWTFEPNFYFYTYLPKLLTIFDCVDYQWRYHQKENSHIKSITEKLIKNCKFFITNSNILAKKYQNIRRADLITKQGFKTIKFRNSQSSKNSKIPKRKKIIGFIGGINYRLDFCLIKSLIQQNPQCVFVFCGPIQIYPDIKPQQTSIAIKKLKQNKQVIFTGNKTRSHLGSFIKIFDIAIIPYDIKYPFNRYCYPMKLFEYFYMGKPVVSTPIEELKRFPKFVKIGQTAAQWQQHINDILSQPWPKKYQQEQRQLAINNSWQNKIKQICDLIEQQK